MKQVEGVVTAPQSYSTNEKRARLSTTNLSSKAQLNQRFCQCGAIIPRDEQLFENARTCKGCQLKEKALIPIIQAVMTTPRRAVRLFRCLCCEKSFGINKMSACLIVCRRCNSSIHEKGKSAKNRLVGKVAANFGKFLQLTGGVTNA